MVGTPLREGFMNNYKLIIENSNDLIAILDERFNHEYVNNYYTDILGYKKKELIGKPPALYVHPDDSRLARRTTLRGVNEGEAITELRYLSKNGKTYWFELKGKFFKTDDGKRKSVIISRDITDRKIAEKILKQSEEKYRLLVKNSPYAILLLSNQGIVLDCNPETYNITLYKKEEFTGKNFSELEIFNDINSLKKQYKQLPEFSEKLKQSSMEFQIYRKDGKKIWVEIAIIAFQKNNQTFYQTILKDISEQKKREKLQKEFSKELEKKVKKRTKKLGRTLKTQKLYMEEIEKASQFKSEFMAKMSHELRTPLNSIMGFTDLLLGESYGKLNETQKDYLSDIHSSANNLFNLVSSILDISKIDSGKMEIQVSKFFIKNLVNNVISNFESDLKEKNIKISLHGFDENKKILADPLKLKSIFYNLINNAIKFTVEGRIDIFFEEDDYFWKFKVKDTGIGIANEDFDKVFKEFKKIDNLYINNEEGSGLGLALTKKLVNLHGGKIWFESKKQIGTTFIFTIPNIQKIEQGKMINDFLGTLS
ncbi:MAG: putative Histidine kinase [Promethearchaeota archaeon]|nr:MAG: putative Histidine kinase [Candidatus Lokiarchaeota archaeon]